MPFAHPALADLRAQLAAQIAARLPGADMTLRRSALRVLSDTFAAGLAGEYGYLDWMVGGVLLPDTCEGPYLDRQARIYGLTRKAAFNAAGTVAFSGSNGLVVPGGTLLQTSDGALGFYVTADVAIAGGTATASVIAGQGGAAGNLASGVSLAMATAVAGVQGLAIVQPAPGEAGQGAPGLTGGTDAETDAALRARLLARIRQPPQGGAATDYVEWALAQPNVTRAWAYPLNRGPGTCDVAIVCDARANIIPTGSDVAAVQAALGVLRPVTADCVVFAPTAAPLNVTISGLTPSTSATQAAVQAALAAMLAADAIPGGTVYLSQIVQAIADAAGVSWFTLGQPVANVVNPFGTISTLGAVVFQ